MPFKKRISRAVEFQLVKYIAQLFYFTGLTALIPLLPLLLSPYQLIQAKYAFGFALGFIVLGFFLVYWFSASKKVALRVLGMTTLFPGLVAVIFSFTGPRRMAIFLRMLGDASPYLEEWIKTYIPKAWLLAGIYIIVGVALIWLSEQAKN
ncbi:MAG TPA: hypothetical protein VI612_03330 [Candidatus Nanoarchaeia archaeon]|nr:hypothetical protein [Candidatus Nanoarchaeia archaeon]